MSYLCVQREREREGIRPRMINEYRWREEEEEHRLRIKINSLITVLNSSMPSSTEEISYM